MGCKSIMKIFLVILAVAEGFYLPVLAPVNYCRVGDTTDACKSEVTVYVNSLNTEESILSYEYDHFDFCLPQVNSKSPVENLGQVVFGERIRPSGYKIEFMKNTTCEVLCPKKYTASSDSDSLLSVLRKGIRLNYQHRWIVDINMPVTSCFETEDDRQYCSTNFPMGCYSKNGRDTCYRSLTKYKNAYYIYNHVDLYITYHSGANKEWGSKFGSNGGRIISIKVVPRSIKHNPDAPDCSSQEPMEIPTNDLKKDETVNIVYTYSVTFTPNNTIKWS